jgi:hypothetical protein
MSSTPHAGWLIRTTRALQDVGERTAAGAERGRSVWSDRGGRTGREPALVRASGARQQACTDCNEPKVSRHGQLLLSERDSVLTAPLRAPHAMLKMDPLPGTREAGANLLTRGEGALGALPFGAHVGRADGRQLYYVGHDRRMMTVPVRTRPSLWVGIAQQLFELKRSASLLEVSRDGRFLLLVPQMRAAERPIIVDTSTIRTGRQ